MENQDTTCDVCYKIVCRKCGWEPSEKQLSQIKVGLLTACPNCGWKPGDSVSS